MPPSDYNENYGQVKRIYARHNGVCFDLKLGKKGMNPRYYFIKKTHANYSALVALLYMAANLGYVIYARTMDALDANNEAEVTYLVVDW